MKVFKRFFDFYINSSIHVALAVFSLSYLTLLEFDLAFDHDILYFIFYASITAYNFVKYFGLAKFHHRRLTNRLKIIQIFSFLCFILCGYYALKLNTLTLYGIMILGIITFLYAVPFLPNHLFLDKQHNLRSISGLKIYLIALVWVGVSVFLPLMNANYDIDINVLITSMQRFVFVVILMLPFEIRDLQYDSIKLSTIPQKIGIKLTKIMGVFLLTIFFLIEFLKDNLFAERLQSLLIISIITLAALLFSKKNQRAYYSSFWVEGIPIVWLFLILIS